MSQELDLSCFSYLASARVLQIQKYPELNGGAEVTTVFDTLAADAPMTAITASKLGLKVSLIANPIGTDEQGKSLANTLQENRITNSIQMEPNTKTPFITVLSDEAGNREWFSYTTEAQKNLLTADLSQLGNASLAYIDLYTGIQKASLRAIDYATEKHVPTFLNLSGDLPTPELIESLAKKNLAIVQIGLHESMENEALEIATKIYQQLNPKICIVTLASKGAVAIAKGNVYKTAAYPVDILHVHGAGAVFSGAFAFGYLQQWELKQTLEFACALGSLSCTKKRGFEQFTMQEVQQFMLLDNK